MGMSVEWQVNDLLFIEGKYLNRDMEFPFRFMVLHNVIHVTGLFPNRIGF